MKYLLSFLLLIFFGVEANASDFSENFKKTNSTWNMCAHLGVVGHTEGMAMFTGYGSLTIHGCYLDFGFSPRTHRRDVDIKKWDDKEAYMFHTGYQIPISKKFRAIPLIGFVSCTNGVTDGANWSVDRHYGINNSYTANKELKEVDYGAAAVFYFDHLVLQATATRYCLYAGFGYEF